MIFLTEGNPTITLEALIAIGMFILAEIVLFLAISKSNSATKVKLNENSLKIVAFESENNIKTLSLQRDVFQLRLDFERQIKEIKEFSFTAFKEFEQENKKEHKELAISMESAVIKLTEVSTAFKLHSEISLQELRRFKGRTEK